MFICVRCVCVYISVCGVVVQTWVSRACTKVKKKNKQSWGACVRPHGETPRQLFPSTSREADGVLAAEAECTSRGRKASRASKASEGGDNAGPQRTLVF